MNGVKILRPGNRILSIGGGIEFLGGGAAAAGVSYLIQDTFTDAAGTALASHTPDIDTVGGGWTVVNTFTIALEDAENSAARGNTSTVNRAIIDAGQADVQMVFDAIMPSSGGIYFFGMMRYQDVSNHWFWRWTTSGNTIALVEKNAGVDTTRATTALAPSNGAIYSMKTICSGNTIQVYVDDVLRLNYASATFLNTLTNFGFGQAGTVESTIGSRFDNLEVSPF